MQTFPSPKRSKRIGPLSLLPVDPLYRRLLLARLKKRTAFVLLISAVVAGVSALINSILAIVDYYNSGNGQGASYIPAMTDAIRAAYYILALMLARLFPSFGCFASWSIPVVFSVSITEAYTSVNNVHQIYTRLLSVTGLLVLQTKFLPTNYVFAAMTALVSYAYPLLRSRGTALLLSLLA